MLQLQKNIHLWQWDIRSSGWWPSMARPSGNQPSTRPSLREPAQHQEQAPAPAFSAGAAAQHRRRHYLPESSVPVRPRHTPHARWGRGAGVHLGCRTPPAGRVSVRVGVAGVHLRCRTPPAGRACVRVVVASVT